MVECHLFYTWVSYSLQSVINKEVNLLLMRHVPWGAIYFRQLLCILCASLCWFMLFRASNAHLLDLTFYQIFWAINSRLLCTKAVIFAISTSWTDWLRGRDFPRNTSSFGWAAQRGWKTYYQIQRFSMVIPVCWLSANPYYLKIYCALDFYLTLLPQVLLDSGICIPPFGSRNIHNSQNTVISTCSFL